MTTYDHAIDDIERRAADAGISLPPGASEEALAEAEAALGVALPPEVRAFYLRHDGGGEDAFHVDGDRELLTLEGIVQQWRMWKQLLDAGSFDDARARPDDGVQARWFAPGWIPITFDAAGAHHMLDLEPARGGTRGQVLAFWHDAGERTIEGPDFLTWLQGVTWGDGDDDDDGDANTRDEAPAAPEPTFDAERAIFERHAGASKTIPRADLPRVMADLGQAHLVAQANDVIDFMKRYAFEETPDDRVSWTELKAWLKSDKPA